MRYKAHFLTTIIILITGFAYYLKEYMRYKRGEDVEDDCIGDLNVWKYFLLTLFNLVFWSFQAIRMFLNSLATFIVLDVLRHILNVILS